MLLCSKMEIQNRYHEMFRLLFTPSKALAKQVHETMQSLSLVPKQYSSVHLRVKYPLSKDWDETKFTYKKFKDKIVGWANNAVNCAAELHPNSTIYVCADNNDTVGYLLEESRFATHYADAIQREQHPLVKLVARDYSNENPHVAFSRNNEADGFMNVFVDMMIMGMGKCVAHGVGGYGRLGAALSGGECSMAHRGRKTAKRCPDALGKIQSRFKPPVATANRAPPLADANKVPPAAAVIQAHDAVVVVDQTPPAATVNEAPPAAVSNQVPPPAAVNQAPPNVAVNQVLRPPAANQVPLNGDGAVHQVPHDIVNRAPSAAVNQVSHTDLSIQQRQSVLPAGNIGSPGVYPAGSPQVSHRSDSINVDEEDVLVAMMEWNDLTR